MIVSPSVLEFRRTVVRDDITGIDLAGWASTLGVRRFVSTVAEQLCLALPRLHYLDVSGVPIGNDVKVLAAERADKLETLRLGTVPPANSCEIKGRGVRALAEAKQWPKLRKLQLAATARAEVWREFANASWLPQITVLQFELCDFDVDALDAILARATSLRCLAIHGMRVPIATLVASPIAERLEQLALPQPSSDDLRTLVDAHWPSLHTLQLDDISPVAIHDRHGMPVLQRFVTEGVTNPWFTDATL